ncbi:zinc ABC transporter ATPase [Microbacterium enclense]|uniref:zinc ABC transporter ATPase n=1 Tax=Microbacterium enclense TaxID=993073 RepID=UPI0021A2A14B|nr:zinc ABC transporter ATPase [Microbacterium enclense]MCT2086195.1 zinc ABC transporter ATPase [Microbacterium enclense]
MGVEGQSEDWERIIQEMIERARETAPSEPGVYKLPCGECVVDFFITAEGEERWLVAGDGRSYTRESVVVARHGDHPWVRLYSLADAAAEIARLAALNDGDLDRVVAGLIESIDDREVARIARERAGMREVPLAEIADRFGVDLDEV